MCIASLLGFGQRSQHRPLAFRWQPASLPHKFAVYFPDFLGILADFADYSGYADRSGCVMSCAPVGISAQRLDLHPHDDRETQSLVRLLHTRPWVGVRRAHIVNCRPRREWAIAEHFSSHSASGPRYNGGVKGRGVSAECRHARSADPLAATSGRPRRYSRGDRRTHRPSARFRAFRRACPNSATACREDAGDRDPQPPTVRCTATSALPCPATRCYFNSVRCRRRKCMRNSKTCSRDRCRLPWMHLANGNRFRSKHRPARA